MKAQIIGVTGVIGSGKSTVCRYLQEHCGFHWINADEITHDLYKIGQPGYKKIREYFGQQFVGLREVHRGRLRRLVLKSQQKLWILNKLMHPLIAHEVNKKIVQERQKARSAILSPFIKQTGTVQKKDAPLLVCIEAVYFEPGDLGKFIDQLFFVEAPDEVVMKRLLSDKKRKKIPELDLRKLLLFHRKMKSQNMAKIGTIIKNDGAVDLLVRRLSRLLV